MRVLRAGFIVLLATWACLAQAAPSFPSLSGQVVDSAGILDAATIDSLTAQLEAHEQETSNQVVVATVADLEGYAIDEYGVLLARHWGIGTAEKNNGVVLLVAPKERKVRIEVGYGLEGALPDALAGNIIRKRILPQFREDDYPAGVKTGVESILQAIAGEYQMAPGSSGSAGADDSSKFQAIIPIMLIGFMFAGNAAQRFLNNKKIGQSLIPAGFVGMITLIASNNPIYAFIATIIAFVALYLINSGGGSGGNSRDSRRQYGGFSGGGGGGFSGGGGGFGGGGASGGW